MRYKVVMRLFSSIPATIDADDQADLENRINEAASVLTYKERPVGKVLLKVETIDNKDYITALFDALMGPLIFLRVEKPKDPVSNEVLAAYDDLMSEFDYQPPFRNECRDPNCRVCRRNAEIVGRFKKAVEGLRATSA